MAKKSIPTEPKVPADLHSALNSEPLAYTQWKKITPLAQRDWILWIITAKQSETRKNRIKKACDMLSSGKKRVCCFGGINWLLKTAKESGLDVSTLKKFK